MHEKQIDNLLNLSPKERYNYFIRDCAGFEEIWGLKEKNGGWITFRIDDEEWVFPVWSHYDLAEKCCFKEHREMDAKPYKIDLDVFLEDCIPDMIEGNVYFGVFFDMDKNGLVVEGEILKANLKEEISLVWED